MLQGFFSSFTAIFQAFKKPPSRLITIWIPLDHQQFTDEDQQKLLAFGAELRSILRTYKAMHVATSHAPSKIGMVIGGELVSESTRQALIPTLKQRCPLGTYFVVEEIYEHKDEIDTLDIPLFEAGESAICKKF
jgi:hypothetical protein